MGWVRAMSGGDVTEGMLQAVVADGVATLTLTDNKKRNALSSQMMAALKETIQGYEQDKAVKVVVIRHDGKVFSSGHDLKEINLQQTTTGTTEPVFSLCSRSIYTLAPHVCLLACLHVTLLRCSPPHDLLSLMLAIRQARFPVIAEVGGLATAGGCQLVAACDLAVAADTATFSTPGVKIGLFCTTPGVALARALPVCLNARAHTCRETAREWGGARVHARDAYACADVIAAAVFGWVTTTAVSPFDLNALCKSHELGRAAGPRVTWVHSRNEGR